jgi:regulator of sigma E protease
VDSRGYIAFHALVVPEVNDEVEQQPLKALGLIRYLPPLEPVLGQIAPDGIAAQAGLRKGDRILAIDGAAMESWEQVVESIRRAPGRTLHLSLERDGKPVEVDLIPAGVNEGNTRIGRIGVGPHIDPEQFAHLHGTASYTPVEALQRALARTWELSAFSLEMLGRMITGQASLKNLSGPLTIADYAGQSAESGLASFFAFLALVSISLGVLNLLPVPLLDGGHLLYYFAEFLTGRPVPERIQEFGQKIGMGLLGLLMFFALYNDLSRLFLQ